MNAGPSLAARIIRPAMQATAPTNAQATAPTNAQAIAQAALSLVGAPFKLYGRDPAIGLDCAGVVLASLHAAGIVPVAVPPYRLRNRDDRPFLRAAYDAGFRRAGAPMEPGDIVMVQAGPAQLHMLVGVTGASFVHAHAGLRRVVLMPAPCPWPVRAHLRYSPRGIEQWQH